MAKNSINSLKDVDIYSLSMFVLYKLIDVKEYSVIGELPYILDKKSLFDFCKYFGGRTIKVPTLNEIQSVMHLLLLYQYVNIENIPYDVAVKNIGYKSSELRTVKTAYLKLCKVLDNYNFNRK